MDMVSWEVKQGVGNGGPMSGFILKGQGTTALAIELFLRHMHILPFLIVTILNFRSMQ